MIGLDQFDLFESKPYKKETDKVTNLKNKLIRFSNEVYFLNLFFQNSDIGLFNSKLLTWINKKAKERENIIFHYYVPNLHILEKNIPIIEEIQLASISRISKICKTTIHLTDFSFIENNDFLNKIDFDNLNIDFDISNGCIQYAKDNFVNITNFAIKNNKHLIVNLFSRTIVNYSDFTEIVHFINSIVSEIKQSIIKSIRIPFQLCWRKDEIINTLSLDKNYFDLINNHFVYNNISVSFNWFTDYSYCFSEHWNQFLFDTLGNFYQCFIDFFNREKIGEMDLLDSENREIEKMYKYLCKSPTEKSKCMNCELLNKCFGGCQLNERCIKR